MSKNYRYRDIIRYMYIDIELYPAELTLSACEEGNQAAAAQVAS